MDPTAKSYDEYFHHVGNAIGIFQFEGIDVRSAFLKRPCNPTFTYKPESPANSMHRDILRNLKVGVSKYTAEDKVIYKILKEKHDDLLKKLALSENIGTPEFTKKSVALYGKPSPKLCRKAEEILSEPFEKIPKNYIHVNEAHKQLRQGLNAAGVTGWQITKENIVASALVNMFEKRFKLKKKQRMHQRYINRLIVHEIGVHVLRYENGLRQPLKIFSTGLADYLPTEEGLAAYSEEQSGVLDPSMFRQYAGRVLAIQSALESDFVTTYKNLKTYFDSQTALKLTLRAKRGVDDTSQPGAFTKDYVYLKGYFDVKRFAKKHDVRQLWLGKVSIRDLKLVQKMSGIQEPNFLPDFLKQKK